MGLAATQVRLLQLTSRQHRIEYQAQRIQAQKLQLSNESDQVYNEYMTALDAKKVQYKFVENDGSISYYDATFNNMLSGYNPGLFQGTYALEILNGENSGKFFATETIINAYNNNQNWGNITDDAIKALFPDTEINDNNRAEYQQKVAARNFAKEASNNSTDVNAITYYENLFSVFVDGNGLVLMNEEYADSSEWLTNMLANGEVLLHKWDTSAGDDGEGDWTQVTVSNDTMLQEISDDKELKKAEATYEAETTRINRKDAQYDTLLSQTETERNAIKTEMDSLKQVRNDNIEKAFKCFS